ncbi:MAG: glycosyltransferase family 39 protein [Anaerolineae bacterium]
MHWSARIESIRPLARRAALPCILLVALGLRLYRLGAANLWWDEALAVWAVRKGFAGVTLWTASDVHPPLFFWTLWAWIQLVGESEFAMRLLPALYGVLTVAAVYHLGRLVGGESTGLLAAALTALSRFHVWWSQELRMYVLAGLLGVLSLHFFLRWLRAMRTNATEVALRTSNRLLILCALSTLGALYTIFLSGVWVLIENAVVLGILLCRSGYRRGPLLRRWAISQAVVVAVVALWLLVSWGRMSSWSVTYPVSPGFVARLYAILFTAGASVEIDRYLWSIFLPTLALAMGTWLLVRRTIQRRDGNSGVSLIVLLLSLLIPPVAIYLSTLPRSLFYTPHIEARYFLPFAPAFWVLLAWAVAEVGRRWKGAGILIGVGLVASWLVVLPGHHTDRYLKDDYQTMVRAIVSQAEPGDVVLLNSGSRYPLFLYQYDRLPAEQRPAFEPVLPSGDLLTVPDVDEWLERNGALHERIWLAEVDVNLSDPDRLLRQALDERYGLDWSEGYGHNTLLLFAPGEITPTLADAYLPHQLGNSEGSTWGLRGWEIMVDSYTRGDLIWTTLFWDRAPAFEVRLELLNRHGTVVARRAVGLVAGQGAMRERVELPVTSALVPGMYVLRLADLEGHLIHLRDVRIAGTPDLPTPQGPTVVLDAVFGGAIRLDGYTVVGAPATGPFVLQPGDEIALDLYWSATGVTDTSWTVFTHLIGDAYNPATAGPVWGQHDGIPSEGHWPTFTWNAGDSGIDRHVIRIDPQAPEGEHRLTFGLYDSDSGTRAGVSVGGTAAGDQITAKVVVRIVGR